MSSQFAVGIHQPNYLPWLGYFRKIAQSDLFVFFDNVQMPGGKSFVSRNRIVTAQGPLWLTVPIERTGAPRRIAEVSIAGERWIEKHRRTMENAYASSTWLELVLGLLIPILRKKHAKLADLNVELIIAISGLLGLDGVEFVRSTQLQLKLDGNGAISEILERTGAHVYLTGSGAGTRRYLDPERLLRDGIEVRYVSNDISPYPQSRQPFEPNLSIIDALLCVGPAKCRVLLNKS